MVNLQLAGTSGEVNLYVRASHRSVPLLTSGALLSRYNAKQSSAEMGLAVSLALFKRRFVIDAS